MIHTTETLYKNGQILTDDQLDFYKYLCQLGKRDDAYLFWEQCKQENLTEEGKKYFKYRMFAGIGSDGHFMD